MRSNIAVFLIVACLLVAGAGRLAYIEREQGDYWRQRAAQQQRASMPIAARRGDIMDARGRVLAGSSRVPSIYVDAKELGDLRFGAYSIAPVLHIDAESLERTLVERSKDRFIWIKRGITDDELAAFEEIRKTRRLRGLAIQYEPIRVYPTGRLAAHVIGFVGGEQKGLAGVEQEFDRELSGTAGERSAVVDVLRRRVREDADDYKPPRDGGSVVLTIDAYVQQITEKHLRETVEKFGAEWATAVVMDPNSGEVLAMATVPDFDPVEPMPPGLNESALVAAQEKLRNRAIADSFEPGSMFKPFIMGIALDEGVTRMDEVFRINGPLHEFGSRTIKDTHEYKTLTAHEIISKSSNIGMGMLGDRLKNERLYRYVRSFGFGDLTGIGLPGEHAGMLNDFSRWGSFSTQSIPIGQEIAVTPIQVATAFSVFCNGGVLMKPRIVRGIVGSEGELIDDRSSPIAIRRVMSAEMTRRFRMEALAETVISGTAKSAATADWQVFGKTGTAQIAGRHGYQSGKYTASFAGGAPASQPRIAVVVSVYKPSKVSYYGGTVAAPAVGAIIADTLRHLQVPAELSGEPTVRGTIPDSRD